MNEMIWYDIFLEKLNKKFPKKNQLVEELMKLLCIEREAVYRRLRKDVTFLAHEINTLAVSWDISLDGLLGLHTGLVSFQMQPLHYLDPSSKEMNNLKKRVKSLEHIKTSIDSEYMEVCNKLPRPFASGFMNLYRLKIFYWAFLYNIDEKPLKFADIIIPEKICREFEKYNMLIKNITNSSFIIDKQSFEFIVNNIRYYRSVLFITDEEKELIKKELYLFLDYMENIAYNGYYPETHKKVNIYVSQLHLNTNYSYYYTDKLKSCRIHAFGKFDINSYDRDMVEKFRKWMNQKKRAAIQISEVNERSRIEYFASQRKIVDGL
ncbi:MAG: hypothetical protein LBI45_06230 [Bacteroidales bacterium]|jgi:hypothetical protein|nr:hypothetical protein [Bacteroidales bacterium]